MNEETLMMTEHLCEASEKWVEVGEIECIIDLNHHHHHQLPEGSEHRKLRALSAFRV